MLFRTTLPASSAGLAWLLVVAISSAAVAVAPERRSLVQSGPNASRAPHLPPRDAEGPVITRAATACEAQGIGAEEQFARKVCDAASQHGFRPELVHSYGAGGVDVFITAADGAKLRANPSTLRKQTAELTEWAKRNYTAFNAVVITIVAGDSKIAKATKIGTGETRVELF